jgi:alpha-beta hydrolase superfamily lysophospholipase
MIEPPASNPARTFEEAVERARDVQARDDDRIAPNARTMLLDHGQRRPLALVLFHGLTNHPGQYVEFAPQAHARGANVYVPRMPYQGYENRMTKALARLKAEQLIAAAYDAVDIARGLGEHVAVLGISAGGLQCAYLGQFRDDVDLSVPVAPDFGILQLSHGVTLSLAWIIEHVPNMFLWWDPRVRQRQRPATAYPRFPTHALMQTLRIGDAVYRAAEDCAPRARRIATVVNRADPAVNNAVTKDVDERWRRLRKDGIDYVEWRDLPENHDIIDPDNDLARTGVVYPRLLEVLDL